MHANIHVRALYVLPLQGELIEDASVQRSVPVECLQWHPESVIMAIGWRSGEITVYNKSEQESFDQSTVHRKPLVFLVWNTTGSRLISGDKVETTDSIMHDDHIIV